MGGPLRKGNTIVGGVVPDEVKSFLREQVKAGRFASVSKAVRYYLSLAARNAGVELPPDELSQSVIRSNNALSEDPKQKGPIRTAVEKWIGKRGNRNDRD
ncbi:MAG: hypothetical protein KAW84_01300 [Thermoplasmata archaeon]|nr:hypothetical protein [Thermoplasmata archaeon]